MAMDSTQVQDFNRFVQDELRRQKLDEVSAVDAARWLDRAGVLCDSASRPAFPLRDLLRDDMIAGADQRPRKKHGRWFIELE